MKDLNDAPGLRHRMVLVRKGAVTISGPQPLETRSGDWGGLVVAVMAISGQRRAIVDYTLKIKLSCSTACPDYVIEVSFLDPCWKLRFPEK